MIFYTYGLVRWWVLGMVTSCHVVCGGQPNWWLLVGTVGNSVSNQSSLRSLLDFAGLGFALFLTLVGALLVLETDLVRGNGCILFAFSVLNTVLPIIMHSLYVNDLRLSSVRSCVDSWSILSIKASTLDTWLVLSVKHRCFSIFLGLVALKSVVIKIDFLYRRIALNLRSNIALCCSSTHANYLLSARSFEIQFCVRERHISKVKICWWWEALSRLSFFFHMLQL